ncbi:MAG: amidohydrolase family protein [Myxococcales bacterium]|nr:amidohydrolase family protein [Myxococcales bacterium]
MNPFLSGALFLILLCSCQPMRAGVLITDVKVVSKEGSVSKPVDVYLNNGVIKKIDAAETKTRVIQVLDGKGRYLIPGLIDSHVHLHGVPGESEAMPAEVREQALLQIPKSYLYFGFTTVLDLISGDNFIDAWNRQPLAPTAYYCAGTPIPGGYTLAQLPKEIQLSHPNAENYLFDPRQTSLMKATKGSELHKAQPLVAGIAQTSARCIKAFYERGYGKMKDLPVPTTEMLTELVVEAGKHGLPVYVHGNSLESHQFVLGTGAKMLVHGIWHGKIADEPLVIKSVAQQFAKHKVAVQPTIQVLYGEREIFNAKFFEGPNVKKTMPKSLIAWYQTEDGQWFKQVLSKIVGGVPQENASQVVGEKYQRVLNNVTIHTRALFEAGATLQFGSDTPSGPIYTQFPGYNGREEMTRWVEAGVPLLELFQALTYRNAQLLRLEGSIGSVEEGKRADLLLLHKNPLESLEAYDTIEWVFVKGRAVAREKLAAR